MPYLGLAISATGTGAGKTVISCALLELLRERGVRTGALKPVETGCLGDDRIPEDGTRLREALSGEVSLDLVVPWRLKAPLAPMEAARLEGLEIGVDRIYQSMDAWMELGAFTIVETAGGVMVPLNPRFLFIDLLAALELPVLVVAPNQLGVINHSLLTLAALRSRGLSVIALVLNQLSPTPDLSSASNPRLLSGLAGCPVYEVPFAKGGFPEAVRAAQTSLLPLLGSSAVKGLLPPSLSFPHHD